MINSNGSKPFEAEPRNGPMNQLNSVPSISGSNQQSTRINCCGILLRGFVARWSRQSGKTHCVAVLLLWSCLRNRGFNVLVLAPAVRQSKIIIRKITNFLPRLPKYVAQNLSRRRSNSTTEAESKRSQTAQRQYAESQA